MSGPISSSNTIRWTVNGGLGQGEVFSFGFSTVLPGAITTQAQAQTFVTAVATPVKAACALLQPYVDGAATYSNLKAYFYVPGAGAGAAFIAQAPLNPAGVAGGGSLPLTSCCVVTTVTAVPTRSTRGRLYIPYTAGFLAAHEMPLADLNVICGAVKTILNAPSATQATALPVVYSPTRNISTQIISLRADSRVDTQRRRSQKQTVLNSTTATL